jgi:hypothetical protein
MKQERSTWMKQEGMSADLHALQKQGLRADLQALEKQARTKYLFLP